MDNDVKLGKFISLILRHKPETIDLKLDENGWADTKELIEKISKSGREIDFTTLERIVNENNKKRYSFNEDKTKIRAVQGHSIEVNLELKEVVPPAVLYHGTAFKNVESIKKEGIKSAFVTAISSLDSIGGKPEGKPWKIGLQNPEDPSQIIGIVDLKDKAMGISGDYQTYVEIDGKMYHHILDKETGYPVEDKKMVAVICDNAFDADVYSTTFFLMPIDKVLEYVDNKDGIEVLIVDKDMKIIKSKNFNFQEVKK